MAGVGPMTQDWEPVVVRKKAPTAAANKDEKAVNAARRAGAEIETLRKGLLLSLSVFSFVYFSRYRRMLMFFWLLRNIEAIAVHQTNGPFSSVPFGLGLVPICVMFRYNRFGSGPFGSVPFRYFILF